MEGFLVGTYDDITFYKMEGNYYARMKSSLTGKKFRTHKAFEGSRRSCNRFGRGNKLASMVYKEIPEENRKYDVFCSMKSAAIAMIKAGKEESDVIDGLRALKPLIKPKNPNKKYKIRLYVPYHSCLFRPIPFSANASRKPKLRLNRRRIKILSNKGRFVSKTLNYERSNIVTEVLKKLKKRQVRPPN